MGSTIEIEEKQAEYIIELLKPCLKSTRNKDWSTERYNTAWGTKTPEGLKQSILRIIGSNPECLPKL